jgi:hypothetical protein
MTIDSTWLLAFKEELPHAFTPACSFQPSAVFVDGQIRLMQATQSEPQTWDQFIHRQFFRHLSRFMDRCNTVVLAFDNYAHVPRAKCMTQVKRRRKLPVLPFGEQSELPSMVPEGERWSQCIANRQFKARVIDLVLLRLPAMLLTDRPHKRLVVDYQRPVEYRFDPDARAIACDTLDDLEQLGEADVKFPRHAKRYGKLLVDSIDGDSVPIALRHHELCLRRCECPPMVSVLRLELKLREPAAAKEEAGKRKRAPRTYEHVDVHALYDGLRTAVDQSIGRVLQPAHRGHEMAMLIALIALTGTDFSRNLPQISGRTLFSYLPEVWCCLASAFDPADDSLRVDLATDLLVALIYSTKFAKHARSKRGLATVLDEIRASGISQRVKDSLPTPERIACTARNANWILQYWTCEPPPEPLQPCFGFRLVDGRPEYAD